MRPTTLMPLLAALILTAASAHSQEENAGMTDHAPENVYVGDLIAFPGPWGLGMGRAGIILVSDEELEMLSDPDRPIDLSLTFDQRVQSLRQVCEQAQQGGARTLIIAFDHFFRQYRPGQDQPRRYLPDMDDYIERIAAISAFAQDYGLGLELSLLSPLEIGAAYRARTGEAGVWMHYREGLRDPATGAFSVQLWQQRQWVNNKGPITVDDAGVRVFAFREQGVGGTPYQVVDPDAIVEITDVARVEVWESLVERRGDYRARRIQVHGRGRTELGDLDRVLVVQHYHTPEMDYFSGQAMPFLKELVDRYADAGVRLNGLYADEMHIQQDWIYAGHHDHGEFAVRYVSPGLADRFADLYGERYRDFAKWLVYFAHGQHDFVNDLSAKTGVMHVAGADPEAIRETALLRARYFHLLQDGVVDLFAQAKRYAEERMGQRLEARAHATWAESPTIDYWDTGQENRNRYKYEYTSSFTWSCTVHQAASACYDYFKWGDFLTGGGNDHAEGGWLDRNYWGFALACSTGILNEVPYSYAAGWGMPGAIAHRRNQLAHVFGTSGNNPFGVVEDLQHRDVEVLMLYPIDLVAVEERFGSWMTQYAYCNYITQAKLLERGRVADGAVEVAGRRFTTLATTFEPFPSERLLAMMRDLVESGGRVIWSGPPPVLTAEGGSAREVWQDLFGVDWTPGQDEGVRAPGQQIVFEGRLAEVRPQIILTDLLVDRIYPVAPRTETETAARVKGRVVATHRAHPNGGGASFLGYRPRDDQAASLGYDTRNWFEVLLALGAYPASGRFQGVNDNPEFISRLTPYLACRFPNGTTAITLHQRDLEEDWPGGFARDREWDQDYIERHPLPPPDLLLQNFKVNGHLVDYDGAYTLAFRVNPAGELVAFAGNRCRQITIDGRTTVFADQPMGLVCWSAVAPARRINGGAVFQIMVNGSGTVRIPAPGLPDTIQLFTEGPTPGSRGQAVEFQRQEGAIVFEANGVSGRWIYVTEG